MLRRRASQGRTLDFKSLVGTTMDVLVLIRDMSKGSDAKFYSMYLIKYKSPSLPQMCHVKNPSNQNP